MAPGLFLVDRPTTSSPRYRLWRVLGRGSRGTRTMSLLTLQVLQRCQVRSRVPGRVPGRVSPLPGKLPDRVQGPLHRRYWGLRAVGHYSPAAAAAAGSRSSNSAKSQGKCSWTIELEASISDWPGSG
jgi:hypothetical protein